MGNLLTRVGIFALQWALNSNIQAVKDRANRLALNQFAYTVQPRPRPISMAAEYATWEGLTNRTYSGRQLAPDEDFNTDLPPLQDVLELFRRTEEKLDDRTTLLLPFFAQWFVDGFLRTAHKPPGEQDFRENESPHDINLNQIYGLGEEQTRMLRSKVGGRLKSQIIDGDEYPVFLFDQETAELKPEFEGLYTEVNFNRVYGAASREHKLHSFAVGLEHGNFVLGNTMFNILFLREHNRVAGIISNAHPKWNDERVFQTTRNVLIVLLLKIVVGDYVHHLSELPVFVDASGWAEEETWYRPNWASVEFTLLYRWHDLLPNNVTLGGETRSSAEVVQNNRWLLEVGTEQAFIDASSQKMGAMGLENTPDYLMHIRMLSLQMARTCKLPSFVSYLKEYGLVIPKSFEELTGEQDIAARLATVYDSVEDVEWFVGLFAQGSSPPFTFAGLLMAYMVANDAVTQLFTNPLLSKRVFNNDTFSSEGMGIIEDTERLHDLVIRNTRITDKTLVAFGFDRRD